ncbi:hypothetical protein DOM22_08425 [Bdellovibrio sp. ZAP7]|uniref:NADPH-dependent FMN reductase n=1 Tax=Bdellovibrio sp. ZAP7 TaxID=2231053 RepID=UPI0011599512|nr:NADPH-dependent FMN reductase [Bdellovibrio sp. ZAP7]QDK45179.1 hypothetical protein DOM22_08425 [Bdellovibrio sp. ZAP7]
MKILSLCGSIREGSSSGLLLDAFRSVLPVGGEWSSVNLKSLPYFDPACQFSNVPAVVTEIRREAFLADYIAIATPEYAHGIPGILKNALEWLICEETMKKKVVLFVASPSGGEYVLQYLSETLRTMDLLLSAELTMVINNARNQLSADGTIDPGLKNSLIELSQHL